MKKLITLTLMFTIISLSILNAQVMVKNIEPGGGDSYPTSFYPFKDKLIFWAHTNYNGYQLYISDGTSIGTTMLTNIFNSIPAVTSNIAPYNTLLFGLGNAGCCFTDIDSLGLFFSVKQSTISIWKTDGTVSGTKQITNSSDSLYLPASRFFKLNNMICAFVKKSTPYFGVEYLFIYNPITKTRSYKRMGSGVIKENYCDVGEVPYVFNNKLYYIGGITNDSLFSIDITGVRMFKAKLPGNYYPQKNIIVNDVLIASRDQPTTFGVEPVYYNFSLNTAGLLKDINNNFNYSSYPLFIPYKYFHKNKKKIAYFSAYEPNFGLELYMTDGTPAGTKLARDTKLGTGGFSIGPSVDICANNQNYVGDSLVSFQDSNRVFYKDLSYKSYGFQPNQGVGDYISLGSKFYYHDISRLGKIYRLDNPSPVGTMTFCLTGSWSTADSEMFLLKDSCFYYTHIDCSPSNYTGYELFKFCKNNMYSTVGINKIEFKETSLLLYPNPSDGIFKIFELQNEYKIEIFDVSGRFIFSEYIDDVRNILDLSKFEKGLYIYRAVDINNNTKQGKLIIQ